MQLNLFEPDEIPPHCVRLARSNPTVDPRDEGRLTGHRADILNHLRAHGKATNMELTGIGGLRFGARLEELRKAGHDIRTHRLGGGLFEYELIGGEAWNKDEGPR
jgi:hypothetical protein